MQEVSQIHNNHCFKENRAAATEVSQINMLKSQESPTPPPPPFVVPRSPSSTPPLVPRSPSCLARYSHVDPAPKEQKHAAKKGFFSAFIPLKKRNSFKKDPKKKKVRFAPDEVEPYNWDYSCDQDVYYQKEQIMAMNKERFTDARKLRKLRNIKRPSKEAACDDIDLSKRAHNHNLDRLLKEAFDPERDIDEEVSICGIEHFVYPVLQLEMIRRKKQAQNEVLSFKKAKRQALRLAELSEEKTHWAREVAMEKGIRYCVNEEVAKSKPSCNWRRARRASV
ncbi:hypothetical protein QTG54_015087 [Skeletonema marinoi]|uniref:Uncharacterized protein n=1 Tax=Skeletonema marinoi TaxID=267567 RepID=A0AAD8XVR2_9STRA|nr:hypothetical protein QTG54_015087 [Skeletonema marinoi]